MALYRKLLLATTVIAGVSAAIPSLALAQDEPTTVEEVVVTGSRIPQRNLETTSPITQVTSADVTTQGVTRIEDLVTQLPQAFASQNSTVSNGASGTATVSLRGLGANRTLVLIDGRRMPYGSPNDPAADLNQIPAQMVDRVEVLTGGASAVYGSDAVAGVVNFIMKKNFEGVQLDAQYGFYQHNNDYDGPGNLRNVLATRAAQNPSQFRVPDDSVIDGFSKDATLLMGVNAPDGKGNITVYASYRNNDAVLQANRDYSACSIGPIGDAGAAQFSCGGSGTTATGRFQSLVNKTDFTILTGQNFTTYAAGQHAYNFGPINYYQRPDERYSFGAVGNYEINKHAEVFAQLMFNETSTVAQIAPSGAFTGSGNGANGGYVIDCGENPLLSPTQKTQIGCATDPFPEVLIGRRNVEGGGRQDDLAYQSYRGVIGVRGEINNAWTYDLAAQYSKVVLSRTYLNDFSNIRIARALDVVTNPDTGAAACRSALDPDGPLGPLAAVDASCVPWNIWQVGGVTPEALAYLQVPANQRGSTIQQVVTGVLTGDLGEWGFQTPWANSPVQVALGYEYRRDQLVAQSDVTFETGDLAGSGGPTQSVRGTVSNQDLFAEVQFPIVSDKPMVEELSLDASYRYSSLSSGKSTDTYGIGLEWAPTEDVRFRGSFQKATRAPNILELFTPQGLSLFDLDQDPCGTIEGDPTASPPVPDTPPTATLAQCQADGVPASSYAQYFMISPAGQYNTLLSGNPNLDPETADTVTLGLVFTPSFIPGLNLTVDYYKIEVADLISTIDPTVTIDQCYNQNNQEACNRIVRSNLGTLWTAGGYIEEFNRNIGGLTTSGVDINFGYGFDLDSVGLNGLGRATIQMTGTWLEELEYDPGVGASAIYDCVGQYAAPCGTPTPEWRHRARLGWQTPWDLDLAVTWRHYGEVELFGATNNRPDFAFEAKDYFDLAGTWQVRDNAEIRFGVNNVFDIDPPLSASVGTTGNGNTFPQTYDAMGRYFFGGITIDF